MPKKNLMLICIALLSLIACEDDVTEVVSDTADNEVAIPDTNEQDLADAILPQFFITTNGASIVDEPKIDATLTIVETGQTTYTGAIGIEIRGSSSQSFPKKSYGFETRDENNEDLDVSLLDFPEEEDWILYAPYSDKSLVRNHLIYKLSNEMGRYASRTRLAEVHINGMYTGVYVFMEKLKRDSNRIDINNLKDDENSGEDLTGGYILKIDKADGPSETTYTEINSFQSNFDPPNATAEQKVHFIYDDPDADAITPEQKAYITEYVTSFETALASDNFADADLGYRNYIDTESFIDFFLLNELSNNVDGYRLSTWMTKDKNDKLKMGPIWDFNLAFGNADYCSGGSTQVWAYRFNERCPSDTWQTPFWWYRLLEDPAFVTQLQTRWGQLRGSAFSEAFIGGELEAYVSLMNIDGAIEDNFEVWPVLGVYVWPNNFVGDSYDDEAEYLENWINNRLIWMDGAINNL